MIQTQTIAPATFNPKTATPAALERYNFPLRPTDPSQLAKWNQLTDSYRRHEATVMCLADHLISRPGKPHPAGSSTSLYWTYNWSGWEADSSAPVEGGTPFTFVEGQWTQTIYQGCGCTQPTDESTWAGLGGWNSLALIQAGTDMYSTNTPNAWYEYLHPCPGHPTLECGPSEISGANVFSGDTIVTTSYHVGNVAHFLVTDNGVAVVSSSVTLDSTYFDGTSAEWINERPLHGTTYYPLTNYVAQNWATNNCAAPNINPGTPCHNIGSMNPNIIEMTSNGVTDNPPSCTGASDILATPGTTLSGANFTSYWCRPS